MHCDKAMARYRSLSLFPLTALGIIRSKNIILNPDVNEIIKKDDILLIAGNNELIDKLTD